MFPVASVSRNILNSYVHQAEIGRRVALSQHEDKTGSVAGRDQVEISPRAKALSFASVFSERVSQFNIKNSNSLKGRVDGLSTNDKDIKKTGNTPVTEGTASSVTAPSSSSSVSSQAPMATETARLLLPLYGIKKPERVEPKTEKRLQNFSMPSRNLYLPPKGTSISSFEVRFIPSLRSSLPVSA